MGPLGPVASICATSANWRTDRQMDRSQMLGYMMSIADWQVSKAKQYPSGHRPRCENQFQKHMSTKSMYKQNGRQSSLRFLFWGKQWVWGHGLIDHGRFLQISTAAYLPWYFTKNSQWHSMTFDLISPKVITKWGVLYEDFVNISWNLEGNFGRLAADKCFSRSFGL